MSYESWGPRYINDVCKRLRFPQSQKYARRDEVERLLRPLTAMVESARVEQRDLPPIREAQLETIKALTGIDVNDYE